jgi:hypothetical protein
MNPDFFAFNEDYDHVNWGFETDFCGSSLGDPFPSFQLPAPPPTPAPPQISHRHTFSSPAAMSVASVFEDPPPACHFRNSSFDPVHPLPLMGDAESEFAAISNDAAVTFDPRELGFVPANFWKDRQFTFGELVREFFQKKNSANTRFLHKLYNALRIAESDPFYAEFVGLEWVNEKVIRIDKKKFARLMGIKAIDGSLFHQQGNFPSHGFIEVGAQNCREFVEAEGLEGVDFDDVRLVMHSTGDFLRSSTPGALEKCRWINSRRAKR